MNDVPETTSRKPWFLFAAWLVFLFIIPMQFFYVGTPGGGQAVNILTVIYLAFLAFGWFKPKYLKPLGFIAALLIPILFGPVRSLLLEKPLKPADSTMDGGAWNKR